jgi:chromatin remodeling complex protein RSC6
MAKRRKSVTRSVDVGFTTKAEISSELQKFLGLKTATKAEAVSEIWDYLKYRGLIDKHDINFVWPDKALEPILGSVPIHRDEIPKKLAQHFLKPGVQ